MFKRLLYPIFFMVLFCSAPFAVSAADSTGQVPMLAIDLSNGSADISVYDLATGIITSVKKGNANAMLPSISPDQTKMIYTERIGEKSNDTYSIHVYDIASKTDILISGIYVREDAANFNSEGKILIIDTSDSKIKKMDADGKNITDVASPASGYNFSTFWISPDRQLIAAIENKQGCNDYSVCNTERGVFLDPSGNRLGTSEEYVGEWNNFSWDPGSKVFLYYFHKFSNSQETPKYSLGDLSNPASPVFTSLKGTEWSKEENIVQFTESGNLLSLTSRKLLNGKTGAVIKSVADEVPEFGTAMFGIDSKGGIYFADLDGTNVRKYEESPKYTVTVTLAGTGSGQVTATGLTCSGSTCTGTYDKKTRVILSPAADSGSEFQGWDGVVCKGKGRCSISMTEDKSVTATFKKLTPDIAVSSKLSFGTVKSGASKKKTIKITNSGKANLTISNIEISGADAGLFSLAGWTAPQTLNPKKSLTIQVSFAPTSAGTKSAAITVSSDAPGKETQTVTLSGTGK